MPIKYGEIFVKHNTDNLWTNAVFWFGYDEQTVSEDSTIIVKFDDDDVQEISSELCGANNIKFNAHISINKDDKEYMYFKREPMKRHNSTLSLYFCGIFKNYKMYDYNNNLASYFNCIYYKYKIANPVKKIDVFAILRVKSSVSSPRYQVAYDSDDFSKEELLYLINCIFRDTNIQI